MSGARSPAPVRPHLGVAEESCPCLRDKCDFQARVIRRGGKSTGCPHGRVLGAPETPQEVEGMLRKAPN